MRNASDFSRFNWKWSSFCDFFMNSKYITRCDYDSSWEALRKGNASIARGSNLNLLIEKIKNSTLEDWL